MRRVILVAVAVAAVASGARAALAEPDPDGGLCIVTQDLPQPMPRSICVGHGAEPRICVTGRDQFCIPPA